MRLIDTTLGEYSPFIYGKSLSARDRNDHGTVLVYGSGGITGKHDKPYVPSKGIVIGRKGTVGSIYFADKPFWPIDTVFYITKDDEQELIFNYYLLKSLPLNRMNSDSAVPGLNRENAHRLKIRIPEKKEDRYKIACILGGIDNLINTNKAISRNIEEITQEIYKSWFVNYDPVHAKKIALNSGLTSAQAERAAMAIISGLCSPSEFAENFKEMNEKLTHKLEKMSIENQEDLVHTASLFPSEFEDSELGKIPKDWKVSVVSDFGEVVTGKTPSTKQSDFYDGTVPFVTPSDFDSYGMHAFQSKRTISNIGAEKFKNKILPSNSVLVTCIGSDMGKVTILKEPSITNQQINSVRLNDDVYSLFLYFYFTSIYDHLRLLASDGTTMPIINKSLFEKIKVISPGKEVIKKFTGVTDSISNKILNSVKENINLSQLRDTLLPRLLAGEINLSQIKIVEDDV